MNRRAEALAARLEEGAAGLATFAEGLTEAEWVTPVRGGSGNDNRPVGVIVDHVANMYPVEVTVAQAIAGGNAVMDVPWEAVASMNADHARAAAGVTKADALAKLKKNASDAAAAIRVFSDEQLDTAAPFSLAFGAPVTAQFVIEDHAMRHSWHHLARIRTALGK